MIKDPVSNFVLILSMQLAMWLHDTLLDIAPYTVKLSLAGLSSYR